MNHVAAGDCPIAGDGLVDLYCAGALGGDEGERLREHLESGCPECRRALHQSREAAGWLAASMATEAPPPSLRLRLKVLAKRKPGSDSGGKPVHVVRNDEGSWKTIAPGVSAKLLYFDREQGLATSLVRMAPGAAFAPHIHNLPEQCLVLEGTIAGENLTLRAGDYQCAPAGSLHERVYTETGCLLLILASPKDEPVA